MKRLSDRALWTALFVPMALAAGAAWRAEIELHGWAGLAWIEWFHWAVPAGLAGFIGAALAVASRAHGMKPPRLAMLGAALALFAAAGHVWTERVLFTISSRALVLAPHPRMLVISGVLSLALTPLALAGWLALLRLWPGWRRAALATAIYAGAVPLTAAVLGCGGVEAIKRGWPVPLLFLALGLLFWPTASAATR